MWNSGTIQALQTLGDREQAVQLKCSSVVGSVTTQWLQGE